MVTSRLNEEMSYYSRKFGTAVVLIARAARHAELTFGNSLTANERRIPENAKNAVSHELRKVHVVIPDNLAFAG